MVLGPVGVGGCAERRGDRREQCGEEARGAGQAQGSGCTHAYGVYIMYIIGTNRMAGPGPVQRRCATAQHAGCDALDLLLVAFSVLHGAVQLCLVAAASPAFASSVVVSLAVAFSSCRSRAAHVRSAISDAVWAFCCSPVWHSRCALPAGGEDHGAAHP